MLDDVLLHVVSTVVYVQGGIAAQPPVQQAHRAGHRPQQAHQEGPRAGRRVAGTNAEEQPFQLPAVAGRKGCRHPGPSHAVEAGDRRQVQQPGDPLPIQATLTGQGFGQRLAHKEGHHRPRGVVGAGGPTPAATAFLAPSQHQPLKNPAQYLRIDAPLSLCRPLLAQGPVIMAQELVEHCLEGGIRHRQIGPGPALTQQLAAKKGHSPHTAGEIAVRLAIGHGQQEGIDDFSIIARPARPAGVAVQEAAVEIVGACIQQALFLYKVEEQEMVEQGLGQQPPLLTGHLAQAGHGIHLLANAAQEVGETLQEFAAQGALTGPLRGRNRIAPGPAGHGRGVHRLTRLRGKRRATATHPGSRSARQRARCPPRPASKPVAASAAPGPAAQPSIPAS